MRSGKAVASAIRGHILTHLALISILLEYIESDVNLNTFKLFYIKALNKQLGLESLKQMES